MNYEQIESDIKMILTEKRFKHSVGVAKRAVELAKIYGLDEEKARLIGIAHDIAKEMPKEEAISYAKENGIIFDEIEKNNPKLWHSKLGADMVKKKYGFTPDMAQAILYHTTGNVSMNEMDKIIYIADKTEENREMSYLNEAIQISNKSLDEGVLFLSRKAVKHNIEKETLIHPDTVNLINKIMLYSNKNN